MMIPYINLYGVSLTPELPIHNKAFFVLKQRPESLICSTFVIVVLYPIHYNAVIMSMMASQITNILTVCSAVCSGTDKRTSNVDNVGKCFHLMMSSCWKYTEPCHKETKLYFTKEQVVMCTLPVSTTTLPAKLFSRNINMNLLFLSFLHTDMTQEVEILSHGSQGSTYFT